ncbi:BgTH12-00833 [Blumeria graminis f. sp. triticale]|uniref:Bgt-50149 n=2 Tax=Blumeria graminis TaxID=34373 RepID=A0A9X9QFH6_BLUGR|nr:BgTH12-00833 [Blumeria graminis f. sp. triticale]VDB93365.1 Bgt-50149 [Blumeria graminis f. sp. tritici]
MHPQYEWFKSETELSVNKITGKGPVFSVSRSIISRLMSVTKKIHQFIHPTLLKCIYTKEGQSFRKRLG